MKIGLIAADGHNFPNLALMKIAAYHKQQGDTVEWVNYFEKYDKVYISKVFTFTPDVTTVIQADEIERGGTGYSIRKRLHPDIDALQPDYSIYQNLDGKTAYGFLTRGCIRNCKWCVVPAKEGAIKAYMDIEVVLQGRENAILMDNNILACAYGLYQLERIAKIGCKVDFNQGLDARLVTGDVAKMLSKIKWIRSIRFSCDSKQSIPALLNAVEALDFYGVKPNRIFCYVLLNDDIADSLSRIETCRKAGIDPFAQPYRDFTTNQVVPQWQKDMSYWCNQKQALKSCDFRDYQPRRGFYCREYF
ncbi:MAG: radical SAM protein, partial [Prevotellaceae bacterium]|nr:radical SAM protein [Prevotellaceae bacterium]